MNIPRIHDYAYIMYVLQGGSTLGVGGNFRKPPLPQSDKKHCLTKSKHRQVQNRAYFCGLQNTPKCVSGSRESWPRSPGPLVGWGHTSPYSFPLTSSAGPSKTSPRDCEVIKWVLTARVYLHPYPYIRRQSDITIIRGANIMSSTSSPPTDRSKFHRTTEHATLYK